MSTDCYVTTTYINITKYTVQVTEICIKDSLRSIGLWPWSMTFTLFPKVWFVLMIHKLFHQDSPQVRILNILLHNIKYKVRHVHMTLAFDLNLYCTCMAKILKQAISTASFWMFNTLYLSFIQISQTLSYLLTN